ncbi:MAG: cysteine desulfurase-like protein [Vulcanimicrobiaceae bacterium]
MSAIIAPTAAGIRTHFPALAREIAGRPVAYFDGPGGTQVPQSVVDAIAAYLLNTNANDGWSYATSRETDTIVSTARAKIATFLNAAAVDEIVFGANMTTLTFHLARAVGRSLRPGDEIIVTDLDHHANVDPWVALARDYGASIRRVPLLGAQPVLDLAAYRAALSPRTKLVAVGLSSNAFGTINPVAEMIADAHAVGALAYVDAVHAAAHAPLDVRQLDADFLVFSAYKVYGPHVGIAYVRDAVLEGLDVPKLAPQASYGPKRAESGTQNFEGIAGAAAALDFIARLAPEPSATYRDRLVTSLDMLAKEEATIFRSLVDGLRALDGVTVFAPPAGVPRHPTVAFAVEGVSAGDVARRLSDECGVFVSHGNFYAATALSTVAPALAAGDGVVRAGVAMYTTHDDAARLVAGVKALR